MQQVPLFGTGTGTQSSNVSAQSRINMYGQRYGEADKTPLALFPRPGLSPYSWTAYSGAATTLGQPRPGVIIGPARSMSANYAYAQGALSNSSVYGVMGNVLYQLLGGTLYLQYADYINQTLFATSAGPVQQGDDGINILILDGVNGYYAPLSDPGQCQPITDVDFPQTTGSVAFVASRAVVPDPAFSGRFVWSAPGDVTSWDPLDFATAESCSDPLTCTYQARGELLLFGTETIEFWAPTGDTDVFRRIGSSGALVGTTAKSTIRTAGDSVIFLGRSQGGDRQVFALRGYQPQPISDPDVDAAINSDPTPDAAVALYYVIAGHQFYQLNLTNTSWVCDLTNGGSWSQFKTGDSRHAAQYMASFNGYNVVSDYRSSRLHFLDVGTYTDSDETITRELVTRHVFNGLDPFTCDELVVDFEAGVGLSSGQGSDPQVMLQVSKDGGHTWSDEMWASLGAQGQYGRRAVWLRLGNARDWMFRLRMTDPVRWVVLGGWGRFS